MERISRVGGFLTKRVSGDECTRSEERWDRAGLREQVTADNEMGRVWKKE